MAGVLGRLYGAAKASADVRLWGVGRGCFCHGQVYSGCGHAQAELEAKLS